MIAGLSSIFFVFLFSGPSFDDRGELLVGEVDQIKFWLCHCFSMIVGRVLCFSGFAHTGGVVVRTWTVIVFPHSGQR